ncbi:MAG: hypothetical protein JRH01_00390 [Deltaproteobacteria bacterium]|nr:hypothetical protein [Deltaproteobacteria bacterium]MBW2396582.1 hypothetical protein [Deltaproteobacteria bacterium]
MKFYRHWARATASVETPELRFEIACYGGSETSLEDARREAAAIASRAAAAIRSGKPRGEYPYSRGPVREELLDEISDGERLQAVTTRNAYGATVLNSAGALFADIDYPEVSTWSRFRSWFGGNKEGRDEAILTRVDAYTRQHPRAGLRLYRTANGFRCVATHRTYEPGSRDATELLEALGSDPLYVRLCTAQKCFRARLTPKFWRCSATRPPSRYPWASAEEERAYRMWQESYERQIRDYSTCALVGSFGSSRIDHEVGRILDLHDRIACNGDAPLA